MTILIGIVGWTGTVLLLVAYALLTARKIPAAGWTYQTMNLVGALSLMANSAYNSAWPSAALNLVWLVIGAVGLVQGRRRRRPGTPVADTPA